MCGIVGLAGNLYNKHSKVFRDMLCFDYIRGVDSTGVAAIPMNTTKDPLIEKELGHPGNLWDWKQSELFDERGLCSTVQRVLIGHNRHATLGRVNVDNAHPFNYDHITGVHNGSLRDWADLEGWKENDVDSKSIFQTIAKKGIDHCWKNFVGAAALVWWDQKDQTLNLVRNAERPLWVCYNKEQNVLFWASEKWMILAATSKERSDIALDLKKDDDGKDTNTYNIFQLKPHHLHIYKPTATTCPLVEVRELEKKIQTRTVYTTNGNSGTGVNSYRSNNPNKGRVVRNKPTNKGIFNGWAYGLDKADKEVRGTRFRIRGIIDTVMSGVTSYYIIGETTDGEKVKVYPSTTKERDFWDGYNMKAGEKDIWFKMTHRPRIETVYFLREQRFDAYRISSRGVERDKEYKKKHKNISTSVMNNVIGRMANFSQADEEEDFNNFVVANGQLVTELRWKELLSKTEGGDCCSSCGDPHMVEDHEEIMWLGNGKWTLCSVCSQVEETVELLQIGGM